MVKLKYLRRQLFRLLLISIFSGSLWVAQSLHTATLPRSDAPVVLCSSQARQDLHTTFLSAISNAQHSIHLTIYSLSDSAVLSALKERAEAGVSVSIICDAKATPSAKRKLGPQVKVTKRSAPGLMHQKILIIDNSQTWIGSANMTSASLRMHSNLVLAFNSEPLAAAALQNFNTMPAEGRFEHPSPQYFNIGNQKVELWFLPDHPRALRYLLSLLQQAKNSIRIAMFTWTHPDLTQATIEAHRRGVDVQVILDHTSAHGVSAETYHRLEQAGISVALGNSSTLLHHKMLVIDNSTLINGSANWTRAAFTQNDDCFVVLHDLTREQQECIDRLWNAR